MERLLDEGNAADTPDLRGHTALYCAVAARKPEAARRLLDRGANPNFESADQDGVSYKKDRPLNSAVDQESGDLVLMLLERGADPNATSSGRTPLGIAADHGDRLNAEKLLGHGADPNISSNGRLPLFEAAGKSSGTKLVIVLLNNGADIHGAGSLGNCPDLSVALAGILGGGRGCGTALAAAAASGHIDTVKLLLGRGADPTPGVYAASVNNRIDVVRVLLDRGANPNGSEETTPVLYNTLYGNQGILELLLAAGADPNRGGGANSEVLQAGAAIGLSVIPQGKQGTVTSIVCVLRGTAVNLPPLVAAAVLGRTDAVRSLLDRGADPNAVAAFDPPVTPLMAATAANNNDVSAMLVAAGAQPSPPLEGARQPVGTTPFFCR